MHQSSRPWLSFSPAPARNREADGKKIIFRVAESEEDLLQACRLLYTEYLRAGYICEHPAELLVTRHHLHPGTRVFVAELEGRVVSTAAIVGDSPDISLPMDELYGAEVDVLRRSGRVPAEVCSLASDRGKLAPRHIRLFTRTLFLCCLHLGFDDVCVMVNPRHVPLYRRWCELEIFGEKRHYDRVNAPAVALRTDLHEARLRLGNECPSNTYTTKIQEDYRRNGVELAPRLLRILAGYGDALGALSQNSGLNCRTQSPGGKLFGCLTPECRALLKNTCPSLMM
jgi:hypothetical protein